MHDWNHDGKVDLLDGFIQDEIESRNTGNRSTGGGSCFLQSRSYRSQRRYLFAIVSKMFGSSGNAAGFSRSDREIRLCSGSFLDQQAGGRY